MPTSDPLDEFIDAAAAALQLPVDPAWKPAVKTHLQVTLRLGATVSAFALPDEAEPAPVFKA
jgi:hypothetical protein